MQMYLLALEAAISRRIAKQAKITEIESTFNNIKTTKNICTPANKEVGVRKENQNGSDLDL